MGTDMKTTYGAESKFTGVNMDPAKCLIVGLDVPVPEDPNHPLVRLADPHRLDKDVSGLVGSMVTHGWRGGSITILKHEDATYVVDGRQRTQAARLANAQLRKAGADMLIRIPAVPEKTADPLVTLIVANEHNLQDTILAKAHKAERMMLNNHSDEEIQAAFGVTRPTLGNWRKLLKCTPEIQALIESGEIGPSLGYEIGKLKAAEQMAAYEAAKAATPEGQAVKGAAGRENVRAAGEGRGTRAPSSRWKASAIDNLGALLAPSEDGKHEDTAQELAYALLQVIRGDDTTAKGLREFKSVYSQVRRVLRASKPAAEADETEED